MRGASRSTARAASAADSPSQRRDADAQRRQPRGGQIDRIVEPRRRPSERFIVWALRCPIIESAVLAALYSAAPGNPATAIQNSGGHHAVGEILRQAFDRGARDAGLIQRVRDRGRRFSTPPRGRPPARSVPARRRPPRTWVYRLRWASSALLASTQDDAAGRVSLGEAGTERPAASPPRTTPRGRGPGGGAGARIAWESSAACRASRSARQPR